MGKNIKFAILGPRGLIGKTLLQILGDHEMSFSADILGDLLEKDITIDCFGTSEDTQVSFGEKVLQVYNITDFKPAGYDAIISAIPSDMVLELADEIKASGVLWIDKSAALRMNEDVPLIVPEVNGHLIAGARVIASPNCIVIPLVMFLKTVVGYGLKSAIISTYQSISGAGINAMNGFFKEMKATHMKPLHKGFVYEHPMICNVIPAIGTVEENNECDEEIKIKEETRKILDLPSLQMSVTSVRVPVLIGHMISLTFILEKEVSKDKLIKAMEEIGIQYSDNIVTPIMSAAENSVFASRLRYDGNNTYSIILVCDNLRKGGALNALQIAQKALSASKTNLAEANSSDIAKN